MRRTKRAILALLAVLVVALAAAWSSLLGGDVGSGVAPVVALDARAPAAPRLDDAPAIPIAAQRASVDVEAAPAAVEDAPPIALLRVRGRVLDLDRRPVAGLEIGRFDRTERTGIRSAADGTFELALDDRGSALEARGPGWATVWADQHDAADSADVVTILVAPAGRLAGVVVDPDGRPVASANVVTKYAADVLRGLSDVLAVNPREFEYSASSDAEGRFDLGEVPLAPGSISAAHEATKSAPLEVPLHARVDLELRLNGKVVGVAVHGRVVDAGGAPAEGAFVALAGVMTKSDSEGKFALKVFPEDGPDRTFELVAVRARSLPARVAIGDRTDLARAASTPFELVLGGAPLAIRGRVVDADGLPVAGVGISLLAEENLGALPEHQIPGSSWTFGKSVEQILRGEGDDWFGSYRVSFSPPTTAQDGTFAIEGLQDRAYDLRASKESGAVRSDVLQVPAGTHDLRIELDTRVPTSRVAGRVVDGDGRPIADARVSVTATVRGGTERITSPSRTTDQGGAFGFEGIHGTVLEITADLDQRQTVLEPAPGDALDDLRIVVGRMRALQVDTLPNATFATAFEVHDQRSARVRIYTSTSTVSRSGGGGGRRTAHRERLHDGRSNVVEVAEGELTAVLFRGDVEVARVPIVFAREGLTVVRP